MGLFDKLKKVKKKDDKTAKVDDKKAKAPAVPKASDKKEKKDEVSMADLYAGKKEKTSEAKPEKKEVKKSKPAKKTAKPLKGDTKNAYKVLIKPVVSEKGSFLGQFNQYVFEVAPRANKIEIKRAIKALYGVDVTRVNVITVAGKNIRYGRTRGKTKGWKKAIITLKEGQSIQLYEGV